MTTRALQRYLQRHAWPQAEQLASAVTRRYRNTVVIPMYDEPADCLARVLRHHQRSHTLVVAVINAPADAPALQRRRTLALLEQGLQASPVDVLPVDCVSHPLDPKAGVGLARKIGTDIAVALFLQGKLDSPWLYQTDADAVLPGDYFDQPLPDRGAVVFGHTHHSDDPQLAFAARLYDLHMNYYTLALARAGSSFAYPTLGSTIAVHAHSYASVHGYPKRNAAEDFYLLNKVAKVHGVKYVANVNVAVQARLSARVPFGTGPALRDIHGGLHNDPSGESYLSYNPKSFELLAEALNYLDAFADHPVDVHTACVGSRVAVETLLQVLRFDRVQDAISHKYPSGERRRQVVHQWFDAGKTMRFIHAARRYHPDQPLLASVRSLPETLRLQLQEPSKM
jgi:hypothetical protein